MRVESAIKREIETAGKNGTNVRNGFSGRFPRWMKAVFWASLAIALTAVALRAIALLALRSAGAPPQLAALDAYFTAHAAVTWIHITCAAAFVLLLPFVFRRHRSITVERLFFFLGAVVGASAYAMSRFAVGGWTERSAVLVFNTLFLFSLARAFALSRRGNHVKKRRWMLRATAILLGVATARPVMGVFFATSPLTHLTPQQFFGIAFWIGWSINTLGIELWLRARGAAVEGDYS
jgi:hypothetical protein